MWSRQAWLHAMHTLILSPLSHGDEESSIDSFLEMWGVTKKQDVRGGIQKAQKSPSKRQIYLLKRSEGKPGANLGKTTGWIHRTQLRKKSVNFLSGVTYEKIDDSGLHIIHDGVHKVLEVENIIICAGQNSENSLVDTLKNAGKNFRLIGGAKLAKEIDAKRAIEEGLMSVIDI